MEEVFFIKNILIKCMKTCVCHQTMSVYCGQAGQKGRIVKDGLINCRFRCFYSRAVTEYRLSHIFQYRITRINQNGC